MKLIKHGEALIALIEHNWEKAYLTSQQGKQEWVPLFTIGSTAPIAEIDPVTRQVRLCTGQTVADQQEVVLHDH